MATMICGAVDWTLDIAWADADSVKALPLRRGVRSPKSYTDGQKFMQWLKTDAKFFAEEWRKKYTYDYANGQYVGDAWLSTLDDLCVSDFYKDTYNQRPHFDRAFFAMMCGLPTSSDVTIKWDRYDEHCRDMAKEMRHRLENM